MNKNNLPYDEVVNKLNNMNRTYVQDLLREQIDELPIEYEIVSQLLTTIKTESGIITNENSPLALNIWKDGIEVGFWNGETGEMETLLDIVIKLPH